MCGLEQLGSLKMNDFQDRSAFFTNLVSLNCLRISSGHSGTRFVALQARYKQPRRAGGRRFTMPGVANQAYKVSTPDWQTLLPVTVQGTGSTPGQEAMLWLLLVD